MILAIDIGNTNIGFGLFALPAGGQAKSELKYHWRLDTDKGRDLRELSSLVGHLFHSEKIDFKKVKDVVLASVVPYLGQNFIDLCQEYFGLKPLLVDFQTARFPLRVDSPKEVGADRLCNAVAAWEKFGRATVVVDCGTATTLDIITAKGEYGGGIILPGLNTAALSLVKSTAQLPKVELLKPKRVVGRNTVECIQSGLYYGHAGMIDHLVQLVQKEEGVSMKVVATGGLASLIMEESKTIEQIELHLTLEGAYSIWEKNRGQNRES